MAGFGRQWYGLVFRVSSEKVSLREHLKRTSIKEDEDRERAAYLKTPEGDEMVAWEKVAAWPED